MAEQSPWLKALKQGDQVAYDMRNSWEGVYPRIGTVIRRIPGGGCEADFGSIKIKFNKHGRSGDSWNSLRLEPATPEKVSAAASYQIRARMLRKIEQVRWKDQPTEVLQSVFNALTVTVTPTHTAKPTT